MKSNALLLFDLGGVLIDVADFAPLNSMRTHPFPATAFKEQWLRSTAVRRFETGKCTAAEFARAIIAEWDLVVAPEDFLATFSDWPKGFFPQARDLIRTLRRTYRVGCFSNSNILHWQRFGGFKDVFDIALSSHLLGVIKPDRDAFLRALLECGSAPHEVRFFDDSPSNVRAANAVGIRAFHVDGFQALLRVLQREGVM
jgi:putative hydrolase of the HAD superfamily